jgi:nucleoid-associated protein YgaU
MADLEQVKRKYSSVIEEIQKFAKYGATLDSVGLDGEKLSLKGTVPSEVVANRVWDKVKEVDPTYSDLAHQIATTGGSDQPYVIQSGDTLSAISVLFYGSANKYRSIAKANGIDDPNTISVGSTITIPVIS